MKEPVIYKVHVITDSLCGMSPFVRYAAIIVAKIAHLLCTRYIGIDTKYKACIPKSNWDRFAVPQARPGFNFLVKSSFIGVTSNLMSLSHVNESFLHCLIKDIEPRTVILNKN